MTWLRVSLARSLELVRRRRRERELEEEIAAHLDFLTDEHRRAGLSPSEARAAARRDFGAIEPLKERYREQRGLPFFDSLHQDCRFAVRRLAKDRWFTVVAVVSATNEERHGKARACFESRISPRSSALFPPSAT